MPNGDSVSAPPRDNSHPGLLNLGRLECSGAKDNSTSASSSFSRVSGRLVLTLLRALLLQFWFVGAQALQHKDSSSTSRCATSTDPSCNISMAFNSPLWKREVLTWNSLDHLSPLGEGDLHLQSLILVPVSDYLKCCSQSCHTRSTIHLCASTLAQQWQAVKLLAPSHVLGAQQGQSAWPEEMATKLPRWQKLHSCPVFPKQSAL